MSECLEVVIAKRRIGRRDETVAKTSYPNGGA
jgi:hypothetical protein